MNRVLWFTVLITCGSYISGQIVDPDLWWHITVGRWIIAHSDLPQVDHWTMFAYGQPWRAYSWLFEIIVAPLERLGGMPALWLFKLLIAVVLSITLGFVFSKLSKDYFVGVLLGVVSAAACFNHFTLRPQSIVWILFGYLILLANKVATGGLERATLVQIALVFCLWANIHITTLLGLGVLFLWVLGSRGVVDASKVTLLGFAATLVTPYVGGEWLTFFSTTGHPFQFHSVAEFQAATILQHSTAFLLILVTLVLVTLHLEPKRVDAAKHLVWLGFTVAGLAVVKFLPFACISLAAVSALAIGNTPDGLRGLGNLGEGINRLRHLITLIPREGLSFLLICWCVVLFMDVWRDPLNRRITPVEAFDEIEKKSLQPPFLVGFGTGGYMMYRFSNTSGEIEDPTRRVPIDGRTNLITPELWQKFQGAFEGKEKWHELIDQVKPKTILWKSESPFVPLLLTSGEWCRIFRSGADLKDGYSLFVPRPEALEKKNAFAMAECAS